jgi:hypothetical protein|tara:strand:+ start:24 stop:458 length:435 start_codon:yes stop_codon:yes gene_type:complete
MQTNETDQILSRQIRQTLRQVDELIVSSDFERDWEIASQRLVTRKGLSENSYVRWFHRIFRPRLLPATLAIGLLIGLVIMLSGQYPEQEKSYELYAPRQVNIIPLDPNKPWYGPTDDLLQVGVLKYEYQWMTYANYDPITMEIR